MNPFADGVKAFQVSEVTQIRLCARGESLLGSY